MSLPAVSVDSGAGTSSTKAKKRISANSTTPPSHKPKRHPPVRVKLRGFGAGRLAAVKAFEMAGLDVVSLTDVTYINWRNNPRAKKQRRL
ncbi:unnamed protein product [Notodromas monacha]|uniref:Ribosomal protein S11 n=1 Tax=Notodromas monacha TaxID=399045 RepID=A0A7R9GG50_9CRUS|nr:unnamed protein product [Notodromas monacha]CAG0921333.1 unnamed protein product [Notodromas monacha]